MREWAMQLLNDLPGIIIAAGVVLFVLKHTDLMGDKDERSTRSRTDSETR